MKIAFVSDCRLRGDRANGIASVCMAQAFAELGHEVSLLVPEVRENKEFHDFEDLYGIKPLFEIVLIPVTQPRFLGKKVWFQFKSWSFAVNAAWYLRGSKYDLIYSRSQYLSLLKDSVFEAHQHSRTKALMSRKRKLVCISGIIQKGYKRGIIAHSGYLPGECNLKSGGGILYFGSLQKGKGAEMIKSSRHKVRVISAAAFKDRYRFLESADVLLIPATGKYNSPLKLIEYMSTGKPIVAPDQPNVRELITGYLFEPSSIEEMDAKIDEAIEKKERLYGNPWTWKERAEFILKSL